MKTKSIFAAVALIISILGQAQSWQLIGDQSDMSGQAKSMVISKVNNMIYSAGDLRYGALTNNQVFKWDFTEWAPVGDLGIGTSSVTKIVLDNAQKIYAIGNFKDATNKYYVRFWNGSSWAALGTLKSVSEFKDIACDGTNIYVAGNFVNPSTGETCYLNKWNGSSWSVVPESNFNGQIHSIAFDNDNNIVVGGEMKNALNFYGVYKISGTTVSEIGKIRAENPVKKVLVNQINNDMVAQSVNHYFYVSSTNQWTKNFRDTQLFDLSSNGYVLTTDYSAYTYNMYNAGGYVPLAFDNPTDIKFDKFGYPVIANSIGKIYRFSQQIGTPLATSETSKINQITIAPNPTTGLFIIKGNEKINSAEIYDASGKLVKKAAPNATTAEFNITGQPKGTYLIKTGTDKKTETHKLILK